MGAAISWSLLASGGLIAGMLVRNSSLLTSWRFDGTLAGTHGEVVAVEPTSSRVNGVAVLRVRFEFEAPDGPRQSSSYGTTFAGRVADVVEVGWPEGHADLVRLLISSKADLDIRGKWGTPLKEAIGKNKPDDETETETETETNEPESPGTDYIADVIEGLIRINKDTDDLGTGINDPETAEERGPCYADLDVDEGKKRTK